MTQVDARQLQRHLGRYLDAVEAGEVLEVRRRRRVIARVVPCSPEKPLEAWPDLVERLARLYPEGTVAESAAELLYRDRDGIDSSTPNRRAIHLGRPASAGCRPARRADY